MGYDKEYLAAKYGRCESIYTKTDVPNPPQPVQVPLQDCRKSLPVGFEDKFDRWAGLFMWFVIGCVVGSVLGPSRLVDVLMIGVYMGTVVFVVGKLNKWMDRRRKH